MQSFAYEKYFRSNLIISITKCKIKKDYDMKSHSVLKNSVFKLLLNCDFLRLFITQ